MATDSKELFLKQTAIITPTKNKHIEIRRFWKKRRQFILTVEFLRNYLIFCVNHLEMCDEKDMGPRHGWPWLLQFEYTDTDFPNFLVHPTVRSALLKLKTPDQAFIRH